MDLEDGEGEPQKQLEEEKQEKVVFESDNDEVINLQIPEIIWQRALANIENFKIDQEQVISESELSMKFLATLMKNSKHLNSLTALHIFLFHSI